MNNKTCGECWWFFRETGSCMNEFKPKHCSSTHSCGSFQPRKEVITNGDKIRQMSNEEIAEMLVYPTKPMNINGNIYYEFTSCFLLGKSYPMREQAVFLTERWINAPAESEGKDE